jgi:tetratricopeptide (TPR) repeat protein
MSFVHPLCLLLALIGFAPSATAQVSTPEPDAQLKRFLDEKIVLLKREHELGIRAVALLDEHKFDELLKVMEQQSMLIKIRAGENNPAYAVTLDNVATAQILRQDFKSAESSLLNGLKIHETATALINISVAAMLTKLADVYAKQGKAEEAEKILKRLRAK